LAAAILDGDGVNPLQIQKVRAHEACWPAPTIPTCVGCEIEESVETLQRDQSDEPEK
jgi:hypothetical protein